MSLCDYLHDPEHIAEALRVGKTIFKIILTGRPKEAVEISYSVKMVYLDVTFHNVFCCCH